MASEDTQNETFTLSTGEERGTDIHLSSRLRDLGCR